MHFEINQKEVTSYDWAAICNSCNTLCSYCDNQGFEVCEDCQIPLVKETTKAKTKLDTH